MTQHFPILTEKLLGVDRVSSLVILIQTIAPIAGAKGLVRILIPVPFMVWFGGSPMAFLVFPLGNLSGNAKFFRVG